MLYSYDGWDQINEVDYHISDDGVVFSKDKRVLVKYPTEKEDETYTIPAGVVSIGISAFTGCDYLKEVVLLDGLLEIGDYAFEECKGLTTITIPKSTRKIGKYAFKKCNSLIEINVRNDMPGPWYLYAFDYETLLLLALNSYEKDAKLTKYICRDKIKAIQKLVELNRIDLIPVFLEKSSKIKLIELNEIIEIVREAKSTETNAILLDYKGKHYTSKQQRLLDQRIVNIAMGKRDLTVAEYKILFDYSVIDDEIKINKVKFDDPVIEIPEMIGNKRVTMIGKKAIRDKKQLQRVILPKHIKAIGEKAFEICHSLSSINLPNRIKSIGRFAFFDCLSLEKIDLPTGLEVIGSYAFEQCKSLKEIKFSKGLKRIGNLAFYDCSSIKSVSLPASLLSIGKYAFYNCRSLEEITLPNSLKSVGECAFFDCKGIKTVTIKSKSVRIGKEAFSACKSIANVNIPRFFDKLGTWYCDRFDYNVIAPIALEFYDKKTKIVKYVCNSWDKTLEALVLTNRKDLIGAFLEKSPIINKETLKNIYYKAMTLKCQDVIPEILRYECLHYEKEILEIDHYKKIFDFVVNGNEIMITRLKAFDKSVEIPEKICNKYVTTIGKFSFKKCKSLKKLILPSSIRIICEGAFYGCDRLEEINLTEGIEAIEESVFEECRSLKSIKLPSTIKSIGIKAFKECKSLCNINIPSNIEKIRQSAFENCTSLKGVIRLDTIMEICKDAFLNCSSIEGLIIPQKMVRIREGAFKGCKKLSFVDLSDKETPYPTNVTIDFDFDDVLSSKRLNVIDVGAFQGCESLTRVSLPMIPEEIKSRAFQGCTLLKSVHVPKGYTKIDTDAFAYCTSLEEITLPSSIVFLDNKAFNGCSALKSIKRLRKEDD